MDHCDECDFDYDLDALRPIDAILLAAMEPYAAALKTGATALRRRDTRDTWSALEYASHVRDMFLVQRERALLALAEHVPSFAPMHREERVLVERQNEQDPARVAQQLVVATELLAGLFAVLDDNQLERTGIYNYPTPQERSIRWIGVHTLHECEHHRLDIERLVR